MRRRAVTLRRRATPRPASMENLVRGWAELRSPVVVPPAPQPVASPTLPASLIWGAAPEFDTVDGDFEEEANNVNGGYRAGDGVSGPPPVKDIVYDFRELPDYRVFHAKTFEGVEPGFNSQIDIIDAVTFDGPDFTGELAAQRKKKQPKTVFGAGSSGDLLYSGLVTDSQTGDRRAPKVLYHFRTPSNHETASPVIHSPLDPWQQIGGEVPI